MEDDKYKKIDVIPVDQKPSQDQNPFTDVINDLTAFVKKNPWATAAIAAGVGFLLKGLFSKRKK